MSIWTGIVIICCVSLVAQAIVKIVAIVTIKKVAELEESEE